MQQKTVGQDTKQDNNGRQATMAPSLSQQQQQARQRNQLSNQRKREERQRSQQKYGQYARSTTGSHSRQSLNENDIQQTGEGSHNLQVESGTVQNRSSALPSSSGQRHQPLPSQQQVQESYTSQVQSTVGQPYYKIQRSNSQMYGVDQAPMIPQSQPTQLINRTSQPITTTTNQGHNINININIDSSGGTKGLKPVIAEAMVPNPESQTPSGFESKASDGTNLGGLTANANGSLLPPTAYTINSDVWDQRAPPNSKIQLPAEDQLLSHRLSENINFNEIDEYQEVQEIHEAQVSSLVEHHNLGEVGGFPNTGKNSQKKVDPKNVAGQKKDMSERKNFANDIKGPLHFRSSSQKFMDKEQKFQRGKTSKKDKAANNLEEAKVGNENERQQQYKNLNEFDFDRKSAQSQSNEIDDLDEQKFQAVKVHQINQPQKRLQTTNDKHSQGSSTHQPDRVFEGIEEHAMGEFDDLANESANVIEFTQTGHSQGMTMLFGPNNPAQQQLLTKNIVRNPFYTGIQKSSQINQINQSGFHQRQSLNEHEINIQSSQFRGFRASNLTASDLTTGHKNRLQKNAAGRGQRAHSTSQNRNKNTVKNKSNFLAKKEIITMQGQTINKIQSSKNVNNISASEVNQSLINENIQTNKLRQFPQKNQQISMFQGKIKNSNLAQQNSGKNKAGSGGSQNNHANTNERLQEGAQQSVTNSQSSTTLVLENMMRQLDQQRKQLEMKEEQMNQLNMYVSQVINENDQLQLKLQIQERNNQILLRQLNQLRQLHMVSAQGSDQSQQMQGLAYLRQPRKPSGRINQKLNHKDWTFENNSDFGGLEGAKDGEVDEENDSRSASGEIKTSPRFNNCDENSKPSSPMNANKIKDTGCSKQFDDKLEDEDESNKDQEGMRRIVNVNKMPHLQSNKNLSQTASKQGGMSNSSPQGLQIKKPSNQSQNPRLQTNTNSTSSQQQKRRQQQQKDSQNYQKQQASEILEESEMREEDNGEESAAVSNSSVGESQIKSSSNKLAKNSNSAQRIASKEQNEVDEDDEDILPSISSARQTDRRIHLNNSNGGGGGAMMDPHVQVPISFSNMIKLSQQQQPVADSHPNSSFKSNKFQDIRLSQFLSASTFTAPNQSSLLRQQEQMVGGGGMPPIIIQDDVVETRTNKSKDDSFVRQGSKGKVDGNDMFGQPFGGGSDNNGAQNSNNNLSDRCIIESSERNHHPNQQDNRRLTAYGISQSQPELHEIRQSKYSNGVYQAQNVNSFMPPTRASQFLKQRVKGSAYKSTKECGGASRQNSVQHRATTGNGQGGGHLAAASMQIISSGKIQQKNTEFSFDYEKAAATTSNNGDFLEIGSDQMLSSRRPTPSKNSGEFVGGGHSTTNKDGNNLQNKPVSGSSLSKQRRMKNQSLQLMKDTQSSANDVVEQAVIVDSMGKDQQKQPHHQRKKGGQRLISKIVNRYLNKRSKSMNDNRKISGSNKFGHRTIEGDDQEPMVDAEAEEVDHEEVEVEVSESENYRHQEENFKGTNEIKETKQGKSTYNQSNNKDEKIQINKVNEMDIKVSRFDKLTNLKKAQQENWKKNNMRNQQQQILVNSSDDAQLSSRNNNAMAALSISQGFRNEEMIPNEEPLIQIRQFSGGGASSSIYTQYNNDHQVQARPSGQLPKKPVRNSDLYNQQRHLFIRNGAERRAYFTRGLLAFPQTNNVHFAPATDKVAQISSEEPGAISDPPPSLQPQFLNQWNNNLLSSGNPGSSHNSALILDDSSPSNFDVDPANNNEFSQINFPRVNFAQNGNSRGRGNRLQSNTLYRIEERKEEQTVDNFENGIADAIDLKSGSDNPSSLIVQEQFGNHPSHHYQQQQLYINQLRRRQQQISNVKGDKGNDTIMDIDEDAEQNDFVQDAEQLITPQKDSHLSSQISSNLQMAMSEQPFDNIDSIDVNIDENLTMSQAEQIQIRNIQNLCNQNQFRLYGNHRQGMVNDIRFSRSGHGRNKLTDNSSFDSNILVQSSIGMGVGHINNSLFNVGIDVNNQSFSQISQIGENLAESREYENQINQIRISHRNFPKHSKNAHVKQKTLQDSQNIFQQVQEAQAGHSQHTQLSHNITGQGLREVQIIGNQGDTGLQQQQSLIYIDPPPILETQAINRGQNTVQNRQGRSLLSHISQLHQNNRQILQNRATNSNQMQINLEHNPADVTVNSRNGLMQSQLHLGNNLVANEESLRAPSQTNSGKQQKISSGESSLPANVNEDVAQDEINNIQMVKNKNPRPIIQSPQELQSSLIDEVNHNNHDVFSLGRSPAQETQQRDLSEKVMNQFSSQISRQNSENLILSEQNSRSVSNVAQLQNNFNDMGQQASQKRRQNQAAQPQRSSDEPPQRLSFGVVIDHSQPGHQSQDQNPLDQQPQQPTQQQLLVDPSSLANGSSQDIYQTSQMSSSSSVSILNAPNTSVRIGNGAAAGQRVAHRQQYHHAARMRGEYQAQSIPQSQASVAAANGGMMRSSAGPGMHGAGGGSSLNPQPQQPSNAAALNMHGQPNPNPPQQQMQPQQQQQAQPAAAFNQLSGQIHGPITFSAFQGRINRGSAAGHVGASNGSASQGSVMRPTAMVSIGGAARSNINGGNAGQAPMQASQGAGMGPNIGAISAGVGAIGGMSGLSGQAIRGEGMLQFDDMGLDEYDVADERQHEIGFDRWEINLDAMSYEDLLRLQERIGYVNKGLNYNRIMSFPKMSKQELQKYLKQQQKQKGGDDPTKLKKVKTKKQLESQTIEQSSQQQLAESKKLSQRQRTENKRNSVSNQIESRIDEGNQSRLNEGSNNPQTERSLNHQSMQKQASKGERLSTIGNVQSNLVPLDQNIQNASLIAQNQFMSQNQIDSNLLQLPIDGHNRQFSQSFNGDKFQTEPIRDQNIQRQQRQQRQQRNNFEEEKVAQDAIDGTFSSQQQMQYMPQFGYSGQQAFQLSPADVNNHIQLQQQVSQQLSQMQQIKRSIKSHMRRRGNNLSSSLISGSRNSNDESVHHTHGNLNGSQQQQQILDQSFTRQDERLLQSDRGAQNEYLSHDVSLVSFTERQPESARKHAPRNTITQLQKMNDNNESFKSNNNQLLVNNQISVCLSQTSKPQTRTPTIKRSMLDKRDSQSSLAMTGQTSQIQIDNCAICFDLISDQQLVKVLQPCNHYFHNDCINQWLIIEKKCPMCMNILDSLSMSDHHQTNNNQQQQNQHQMPQHSQDRSRVDIDEMHEIQGSLVPRAPLARPVASGMIMAGSPAQQHQMHFSSDMTASQRQSAQSRQIDRQPQQHQPQQRALENRHANIAASHYDSSDDDHDDNHDVENLVDNEQSLHAHMQHHLSQSHSRAIHAHTDQQHSSYQSSQPATSDARLSVSQIARQVSQNSQQQQSLQNISNSAQRQ